jgi:hypothetical protein
VRGGAAFEHAGCESAAFGLGHTKGRFLVCACIIYKERERAPSKRSDACTHQPTRQSPLSLGLELELPLGLELRSACIQTRSLFCSDLRCCCALLLRAAAAHCCCALLAFTATIANHRMCPPVRRAHVLHTNEKLLCALSIIRHPQSPVGSRLRPSRWEVAVVTQVDAAKMRWVWAHRTLEPADELLLHELLLDARVVKWVENQHRPL